MRRAGSRGWGWALTGLILALAGVTAEAQSRAGLGMAVPGAAGGGHVLMHEEWASLLAEVLDVGRILPGDATPEERYSLLCADRAEVATDPGGRLVPSRAAFRVTRQVLPRDAADPLRVIVDVPGTALYQLAVEGSGLQRWTVDRRAMAHVQVPALGVALAPQLVPLRAGAHEITAYTGRRAHVKRFELTAFRQLCIAPAGGWRTGRPLTHAGFAHTLVRVLAQERYLPTADTIRVAGEDYASASGGSERTREGPGSAAASAGWAQAGDVPAEFSYRVRLEEPGLFSIRARVRGDAQIWSLDGRYRMSVHASSDKFDWVHVMTLSLASGGHVLRAMTPANGAIAAIEVVRHRAAAEDYVAILEQMGFRVGAPPAVVTSAVALELLGDPSFLQATARFETRHAAARPGEPVVLVERRPDPHYERPLSPVLPSEL